MSVQHVTLSDEEIQAAADALYAADLAHKQIEPLSASKPDLTLDDAYAIQSRWIQRKIAAGDEFSGYKIGLTSRTMQRAMGIDEPDFGVILKSSYLRSGAKIPVADYPDPMVEVELAFVLKHELSGDQLSVEQVMQATDYIVPALELISARSYRTHPTTGARRGVVDTIADNAAYGGIIVADQHSDTNELDLRWCGGILKKNDIVEDTGLAAAVLGHPANGIIWIAKRLAPYGISLLPGQVLLSGSFTGAMPVAAGDSVHADYGALGTIDCEFI